MKVDCGLFGRLETVPERARKIEAAGYSGAVSAEVSAEPFFPLVLAAEHTQRVDLITSIAVAFARNPMTMAALAHDLNTFSKGRLVLGLGSQIEAHITKRFGMPWSRPAARMREYILAMRAIWCCWHDGEKLDFRGEFYRHTLMTPMFTPDDTTQGPPRIYLAAVGPRMTEAAAEVADGLILHPFTTDRYIREVTLPAVERGLTRSGRHREDFEIMAPIFSRVTADERRFEKLTADIRRQIAFYASTPAYRGVLAVHGWEALQAELNRMSKLGQWDAMGEQISEQMLDEFCLTIRPERLADSLLARYGDLVDRVPDQFGIEDPDLRHEQISRLTGAERRH